MRTITIRTIGTPKHQAILALINHYQTYLKSYAKLELIHNKGTGKKPKEKSKKEDFDLLCSKIQKNHISILLTEHGKTYTSEKFAETIEKWSEHGAKPIDFYIAGPFGIPEKSSLEFDHTLSLSPMTFPHETTIAILLEQLYRAETILHKKEYHY